MQWHPTIQHKQPSPYHHIINTRPPRLHKHPNSSSDLLSNSQTAGLVTLNTMTLMPLLLAGAAFAKVSFWTSNFYGLSLAIIQQGSRSIYPIFSMPRVTWSGTWSTARWVLAMVDMALPWATTGEKYHLLRNTWFLYLLNHQGWLWISKLSPGRLSPGPLPSPQVGPW